MASPDFSLALPPNPLGDAVLAFAQGWWLMDESFLSIGFPPPPAGDGQCTTLVQAALKAAGAKPGDTSGRGDDFVWGNEMTRFVFPDPPVPGHRKSARREGLCFNLFNFLPELLG
jgi:hypothetical protein